MASIETFGAAVHREPDFTEEIDRADEAAEADVDEETPSPAQQRHLLRAHVNLGAPNNWRILSRIAEWSMPPRSRQMDKTPFQMSRVRGATDAESSDGGSLSETLPFQSGLRYRHDGIAESAGSRKHNPNDPRHLSRDALPPGSAQGRT